MKKKGIFRLYWALLFVLFLFSVACRWFTAGAEAYARTVYPVLTVLRTYVLAWCSTSLEEITVLALLLWLAWAGYKAYRRRKEGWKRWLPVVEVLLWAHIWFYYGWGLNYFRTDFYTRTSATPVQYDAGLFHTFAQQYVVRLNTYYADSTTLIPAQQEEQIKALFASLPPAYGLNTPYTFMRPKRVLFNELYSSVGVLGFMGPFWGSSQLNAALLSVEYPFTYAHELSHQLGISSEAEANFWAYHVCTHADDAFIRYAGYLGVFGYVLRDAQDLLSPTDYDALCAQIRPEVWTDWEARRAHWTEKRSPALSAVQDFFYDLFLRGNAIDSGRQNYGEVVGMLMSW